MTFPMQERPFALLSIRASRSGGASGRIVFPDGVFIKSFSHGVGVGQKWVATFNVFDPTFTSVESALGMIGVGGEAEFRYGWVSSRGTVRQRKLAGILLPFSPSFSQDGMEIEIRIQQIGALVDSSLSTPGGLGSDAEFESWFTPIRNPDPESPDTYAAPSRWIDPLAANAGTEQTAPYDVVSRLAAQFGLTTVESNGVSTVEPTENGPRGAAGDAFDIPAEYRTALFRVRSEDVLAYLRRISEYFKSAYYDGAGGYQVFIRENGDRKILYCLTLRYALDNGLTLKDDGADSVIARRYTLFRNTPPSDDPKLDGQILDFDIDEDSMRAAYLGGFGAQSAGTDPKTGQPNRSDVVAPGGDSEFMASNIRPTRYRRSLVRFSGGMEPEAVDSVLRNRVFLYQNLILRATIRVIGDPNIDLFDVLHIRVFDRGNKPHWLTGYYLVLGAAHDIGGDSYETSLTVIRDGYADPNSGTRTIDGSDNGLLGAVGRVSRKLANAARFAATVQSLRTPSPVTGLSVIEADPVTNTVDQPLGVRVAPPTQAELGLSGANLDFGDALDPDAIPRTGADTDRTTFLPIVGVE